VAAAAAGGDSPLRLLLVEDDDGDALLVEELLEDSGLHPETVWVRTLADAERELGRGHTDCVLLDLHLPDGDGLTCLERVLRHAPAAAVVVLTGTAESESGAGLAAVATGAQDYLVKGRVDGDLLGRAIRYATQRKHSERVAAMLREGRMRAAENARLERGLLPVPLLRDGRTAVCARYRPGREQALLGGDFYDVVQAADGTVHAVVGDVSGHGPDEAALGVCLRVAWRAFVLAGLRGAELLRLLEQVLVAERTSPEVFATLTQIRAEPGAGAVEVLRAGHPGLLVREPAGAGAAGAAGSDDSGGPAGAGDGRTSDGVATDGGSGSMRVRLVEVPGGPALGLVPGAADWPVTSVPVAPGAGVLAFTDGLIEGRIGPGSERLGEQRLLDLARRHASLPADDYVDVLIATAEERAAEYGGLADDLAVLHLEWSPTP